MSIKKTGEFVLTEIISQAVGYLAGLGAYQLVTTFFKRSSWKNGWGLFSKEEVYSKDEINWMVFIVAYLIGLFVLLAVKGFINKLFKSDTTA